MSQESSFTDPERWEGGEFDWERKVYYTVPLTCLLGTPRNLFEAVQQLRAEIETKDYKIRDEGMMLIETGSFKGRLLVEIVEPGDYDASVSAMDRAHVFSEVHNGPLKTVKQSVKALAAKIQQKKGMAPTKMLIWDFRHGQDLAGQRPNKFVVFGLI